MPFARLAVLSLALVRLCTAEETPLWFTPPQTSVTIRDVFGEHYAQEIDKLVAWTNKRKLEVHHQTELEAGGRRLLDHLTTSTCVVNVLAMTTYLTEAGLQVTQAAGGCADTEDCAVYILGALQSFINVGGYLAGLADTCAPALNIQAACAGSVIGLVGGAVEAAFGLTALVDGCPADIRRLNAQEAGVLSDDASLRSARNGNQTKEELSPLNLLQEDQVVRRLADPIDTTKLSYAWCTINALNVPIYVAQAGNNIAAAVGDCEYQNTQSEKAACTADATGAIASLGNVASYAAALAGSCTNTVQVKANCASFGALLVNAFMGMASAGASMVNTCATIKTKTITIIPSPYGGPPQYRILLPNASRASAFLGPNKIIV